MFTIGLTVIGILIGLVILGAGMDCVPALSNYARKFKYSGNFFLEEGSWMVAGFRVWGALIMGGIFFGFWGTIIGAFIYCLFVAPIVALLIFLAVVALLFFAYLAMGF